MLVKSMRLLAAVAVVSLISVLVVSVPQSAKALNGSDFDPGYIISDELFYDGNAMSQEQIQGFLDSQIGACANSLCLNVLRVNTPTTTFDYGTCSTYAGEANESAARIIFKVQKACSISAKVLLVTLQKEQGLVTSKAPSEAILRKALGQGCPDTADCDSAYYGFFYQVFSAARQFAWYGNPQGSHTSIKVGKLNSRPYHPNADCGTTNVLIQNRATAALYYYTPYVPNAAALANLGGTGNACSSYGNRNFWVYYNNWFGPANLAGSPMAGLDVFAAVPGGVRVAGWAFDPNTSAPIDVHIYVNGAGTSVTAKSNRPDVGATWPEVGPAHGFDITIPVKSSGVQNVCVYGINVGPGVNAQFACRTLEGMTGSPIGAMESVSSVGSVITVSGWAIDPDSADSIPVHVYVDSVGAAFTADDQRADVGQAYPAYGPKHGFTRQVKAEPGNHTVCAYGINVSGPGAHQPIGCRTVTVAGGSPNGVLESVESIPGAIKASGWVFDPDSAASSPVHVYVDAAGVAATADLPRSDIARAFPGYGDLHGFSVKMPVTPGQHNVCAYGIDIVSPGSNKSLGCKTVTAMSGSPVGTLESISVAGGTLSVSGWAYDPDQVDPIPVHVYVDSAGTAIDASGVRSDVGAAFPAYGPSHGYSFQTPLSAGKHEVCVYGINVGPGSNVLLGCKTVAN
ncbi:hypothetical protein AB4Y63_14755 [Leifsonia sp. YAF41]|uniref:hypothetical protein n=1 Tax=Leifsonia sp. YAF41 TaxID=3233086 RepID=UPI003F94718F